MYLKHTLFFFLLPSTVEGLHFPLFDAWDRGAQAIPVLNEAYLAPHSLPLCSSPYPVLLVGSPLAPARPSPKIVKRAHVEVVNHQIMLEQIQ